MTRYINPVMPFTANMPAGFPMGSILKIHGMVDSDAQRFEVNLHCSKGVLFQINPRFSEGEVVRNSYLDGNWGSEERTGGMPFYRGQPVVMEIVAQTTKYSIRVNNVEVFTFNYRYNDFSDIHTVEVKGNLNLTYLQWS